MRLRVAVVLHVAALQREDGVVASHAAVLPGEPVRAALPEDDVARRHELRVALFGAEAAAGGVAGAVGAALGGVGGGAGVGGWFCGRGWEEGEAGEGKEEEGGRRGREGGGKVSGEEGRVEGWAWS